MNSLLVIIRGSRRHWHVVRDTGRVLVLRWRGHYIEARREDVVARLEPDYGWVETEVPGEDSQSENRSYIYRAIE